MEYRIEQATQTKERSSSAIEMSDRPLTGVCRNLVAEHPELFALVKRLGESASDTAGAEVEARRRHPHVRLELLALLRSEIAAVQEVLGTIAQAQRLRNDNSAIELAEAISTLDALNPGSPEWAPAFMQVSELVEAQMVDEQPRR